MMKNVLKLLALVLLIGLMGCKKGHPRQDELPDGTSELNPSFWSDQEALNSAEPLVVLINGINGGPADFDFLAPELRNQGLQVLRYVYDDTRRLEESADLFTDAILRLRKEYNLGSLKMFAHSMGGLVVRKALTETKPLGNPELQFPISLVTLASPFGGFRSANMSRFFLPRVITYPFGGVPAHADLGTTSNFIKNPGHLGSLVTHLKINTHEEGKTRIDRHGKTVDDDKVGLNSQTQSLVDDQAQIAHLYEGHVGPIDNNKQVSSNLLKILEESGFYLK